jgi:hypothetical protein
LRDGVGIRAGEKVVAGLEKLGAGMGSGALKGEQCRMIVLGRFAKDCLRLFLRQD